MLLSVLCSSIYVRSSDYLSLPCACTPYTRRLIVLVAGNLYFRRMGMEGNEEHIPLCSLVSDCVKLAPHNCNSTVYWSEQDKARNKVRVSHRHGILLKLEGKQSIKLAISTRQERAHWLKQFNRVVSAQCTVASTSQPPIDEPKEHSSEQTPEKCKTGQVYHVNECMNAGVPAYAAGNRPTDLRKHREAYQNDNDSFLQYLSTLLRSQFVG